MRVVLDTNILISALLLQVGHPAIIYRAWQEGAFTLVVSTEQLDELRATLRAKPYAEIVGPLPRVERSPDPTDDFLLAISEAAHANYLVTGDKIGLPPLVRHKTTRILSAEEFAALLT
jgi:predicted nucleic acid-binding protein